MVAVTGGGFYKQASKHNKRENQDGKIATAASGEFLEAC